MSYLFSIFACSFYEMILIMWSKILAMWLPLRSMGIPPMGQVYAQMFYRAVMAFAMMLVTCFPPCKNWVIVMEADFSILGVKNWAK